MTTQTKKIMTTAEVAARFNELAMQEKWFEIQEELFAEHVTSTDPPNSPYLGYAEGREAVRKKGENFVSKIEAVNETYTTQPVVGGDYFAVGRGMDMSVKGFGHVKIDQIMLYKVKDGQIISEQFFY